MYSPSIKKLAEQFSKFPTVGPRTATRFIFYLLNLPKAEVEELSKAINQLKERVKLCSSCFKPFEPFDAAQGKPSGELCEICTDPRRDKTLLCVVEKETDLETIENTKKYRGLYFILGGTVSRLRKQDLEKLRAKELLTKAKLPWIKEVIIAINPTAEGETTALYIERLLKPLGKKITRLGKGLPSGGELEYADEETLSSALDNRK